MDKNWYVAQNYSAGVADYLSGSDGIRPGAGPLGQAWADILDELLAAGLMRRSKTGRYWWR